MFSPARLKGGLIMAAVAAFGNTIYGHANQKNRLQDAKALRLYAPGV